MTVQPDVRVPRQDKLVPPADFIVRQVGDLRRPHGDFRPPAAPRNLPGESGLFHGVANLVGWGRHGVQHICNQVARYGPVFRHGVAGISVVCVSEPDVVSRIARNQDGAWSAPLAWRLFLGGLDDRSPTSDMSVTLDHEPHADVRRLLQPAFSAPALAGYLDVAREEFELSVADWLRHRRVAFKPASRRMFATVANRIFMGVADPEEAARLDRAMSDLWQGFMAFSKNPWLSPSWRRSQRGYRTLRDAMRAQVEERRAGSGTDLFSRMCRSDTVHWLDDDALVRVFIGVMIAAFDTTSLGVTSMAYLLATHPEWQEKLRAEARAVDLVRAGVEDFRRMELHDRAWKETLRLFPVAPDLPRLAVKDVELGGYAIPAGTFVAPMLGPAMRDERWWTAPLTFDPDRFSPERAEEKRQPGAFLPFGAGAHACIGAALSTLEAKVFWCTLLSRASIELARPYKARHQLRPLGVVSGDVALKVTPV